ncbi:Methyltransferase [Streptomyces sp. GBA 94-10 4N24]|uniref:SAM-dependent methyltransferase n=1 Tax=Streptomyces sp. GBA 94-10 4N24 TaxID=1218177 RepID=UPI0003C322C4|nr:SAM-dependent methyltransferase [Streptomyces sp. GBA 94-10 4N24]ESP99175.1 Methyltransferase [Streptomyces sp. GBA 94-10 4N24]UZN59683.1 Methyltransferase [Streptomyces sp. GBA 94-10 4N24]
MNDSTPESYFTGMYADAPDPWRLADRWYEHRKYTLTLASLPRRRYRRAFEPGCSVGVLTRMLAGRCEEVVAADRVAAAVEEAAARTADLPHVRVRRMAVPEEWPEGSFDLVVLSELLYYFDDERLDRVLANTVRSLEPGGTLVTVHWDHEVPEHRLTGSQLAPVLDARTGLVPGPGFRDPDFVLGTFTRPLADGSLPPTPAETEGLV